MQRRSLIFIVVTICAVLTTAAGVSGAARILALSAPAASIQSASYCPTTEALDLLELINAHREVNGRQPLVLSVSLGAAATHHAESMASFDYFDYTLVPEGISFAQNIANYGYTGTYLGANIAAGPSSDQPATVFSQWLASPSQRDNLLNPGFLAIGLGFAANPDSTYTNYWAAAFGEVANDQVDPDCVMDGEIPTAAASPEREVEPTSASTTEPTAVTPEPSESSTAPATPEIEATPELPTAEAETPVIEPTVAASPVATESLHATSTPAASAATPGTPSVESASPVGSPIAAATPVAEVECTSDLVSAIAGERVTVTCTGFMPGEELSLYWDEQREENLFDTITSDGEGGGALSFLAPETPSGPYTVIVGGAVTTETATVAFDIRPGLFVLPRSGDPGDVVTADLTGFQPGEAVTLNWYVDDAQTRVLRVVTVGEDGSLTTTFRAPSSAAGEHEITAVGISGTKASALFEIQAS